MQDLISREAAIEAASYGCGELRGVFERIEERLLALPSVQPERKVGKWEQVQVNCLADMDEDIKESMSIASMFCPSCKRYHNEVYLYGNPTYGINFCQNCGADMRGGKDEAN